MIDEEQAWAALLECAKAARQSPSGASEGTFGLDPDGALVGVAEERALLSRSREHGWRAASRLPADIRSMLELYLPVCNAPAEHAFVVAHLGQSIDGYIATRTGDSCFVTGPDNIVHLHRMRALCSTVLVGAQTIATDDPELTTRLVDGPSPTRVVLDPGRRLAESYRVFSDGQAPTLLVCSRSAADVSVASHGQARVVRVGARNGRLDLRELFERLLDLGLPTVFVEGGGTTVSRMFEDGLLDRLQIAVAPLLTGGGRRGISIRGPDVMKECTRLPARTFRMGEDVLFDCDLAAGAPRADYSTGSRPS